MKNLLTLTMLVFSCNSALTQPGTLDKTFSGDGKVKTTAGIFNSGGSGIALQSDGKTVVAGYSDGLTLDRDFTVLRYNTNGKPDISFGSGGKVTTGFGGQDNGAAVAIQSNGKIVVVGSTDNGSDVDFALARYNINGTLDHSFGGDGRVTTGLGQLDYANAIAIQSNGKIVVAGSSGNGSSSSDFAVVRYNSNGTLDNTFGAHGIVFINFGGYDDARGVDIHNGKIVVVGYTYTQSLGTDFALAKLNSDGTLDNSLGGHGKMKINFEGEDYGYGVAIQNNGKIVVAGDRYSNADNDEDFAVARINTNGRMDSTFGGDGKVTTGFGFKDFGQAVAIQGNGKIVVAGFTQSSSDIDFAVARYNTNGTLDHSFGGNGKVTTGLGSNDYGRGVAIQSNGKIVVAGSSGKNNFAVVRYIGDAVAVTEAPMEVNQQDKVEAVSFSLSPDPVRDVAYIRGLDPLSSTTISITDIAGNTLRKQAVTGSEYRLNLSALHPGIYYAIITVKGRFTRLQFIKQ